MHFIVLIYYYIVYKKKTDKYYSIGNAAVQKHRRILFSIIQLTAKDLPRRRLSLRR